MKKQSSLLLILMLLLVELFPSVGIFEVDAQWDAEDYCGRAFYSFCTKAAE